MRLGLGLCLLAPPVGALLVGCASTASSAGTKPAADAASGPQPVGAPCDPSLASPCLGAGDPCLTIACDPLTLVCTEEGGDASAVCNGGARACAKNADCDLGLVCAFPLAGGCGAAGICLNPPLPCQADAAACATGGTACSCDGATVPIIVPGFATAPAVNAGPCPPGTPTDAGGAGDTGGEEGGEGGGDQE